MESEGRWRSISGITITEKGGRTSGLKILRVTVPLTTQYNSTAPVTREITTSAVSYRYTYI